MNGKNSDGGALTKRKQHAGGTSPFMSTASPSSREGKGTTLDRTARGGKRKGGGEGPVPGPVFSSSRIRDGKRRGERESALGLNPRRKKGRGFSPLTTGGGDAKKGRRRWSLQETKRGGKGGGPTPA